ncbi:23S rRNA (uracil(1939)-C(5))-methyltransferase RlmD [Myxococcota bacterium]|nr:23S rRNA (uracil(1939)-C(5))-methyltransferase RlmD [Myxococcota bacterium]
MSATIRKGDVLEMVPDRWGDRGEALATARGWEVRVRDGIPGERVRVRIGWVSAGARVAAGTIQTIPAPAKERRKAPCPLHDRCSGCGLQHVREPAALAHKSEGVVRAFAAEGLALEEVQPAIPSPSGLGYRAKEVLLPQGIGKRLVLGARPHRGDRLVETAGCPVLHPAVERAAARCRGLLAQAFSAGALPLAGPEDGDGLRSLVLRGNRRGEVQATLVHRGEPTPGVEAAARGLVGGPIVAAWLQRHDVPGNSVTGAAAPVLVAGQGPIREKLLGLLVEVPPTAFFQVNPLVAEGLYAEVVRRAAVPSGGKLLELFCGVGVAGIAAARQAGARLVGVESSALATGAAERNAAAAGLAARFVTGRVEDELPGLLAEGGFDAVLVNPPRSGCPESALRTLAAAGIPRIVYMSCNPATLARDARILAELGYRAASAIPADLLPQTPHVEVVATFVPGVATRVEVAAPPPVEAAPPPPPGATVVERRPAASRPVPIPAPDAAPVVERRGAGAGRPGPVVEERGNRWERPRPAPTPEPAPEPGGEPPPRIGARRRIR